MKTLCVNVLGKVATYRKRDGVIICGNSDYQIHFTFDSEWEAYAQKTARFIWNGQYVDIDFTGDTCAVPLLQNTQLVQIGVYAGDLSTTTSAFIECKKSILCENAEASTAERERQADRAEAAAVRAEDAAVRAARTHSIGENGNWWIGDEDTGVHAQGAQGPVGANGVAPHIGENGNWWIDNVDTGVRASVEIIQTTGESDTAVMSQKAVTKEFETFGRAKLHPSDFVNGQFVLGTGIVSNNYSIINSNPIRVRVGERISIKTNGLKVWAWIDAENDLSLVEMHLKNLGIHTEDFEYVSEYDGYLFAQINNPYGITPSDYACDVTVGDSIKEKVESNTEKITATEDATKCVTKLKGKKIVNFGDSIFGNYRDRNEDDKSISAMISEQTGATCYNAGFGGCLMTHVDSVWGAFSMHRLADSVNSGSWSIQEEAIANGTGTLPAYFSETVDMLKSMDWNTVDIITIGYGVNDYTSNRFIEDTDYTFANDYEYYKGALRYSVRQILIKYPHIKIAVITPTWKWNKKEDGSFDYSSDDIERSKNTRGYALVDYVEACMDVARELHVICVDDYYNLGINEYNYLNYFNSNDGTHPNKNGRQLCANNIVAKLIGNDSAAPRPRQDDVNEILENWVVQGTGDSETAVMSQKAVTREFENLGVRSVRLSSSDFVRGYYQQGIGIVKSDYSITSVNSIKVSVGERISIKTNGLKVWAFIRAENDLSTTDPHVKNLGNEFEVLECISEWEGYLVVQINDPNGITPSDYACDISVSSNRMDELEQDIASLESRTTSLESRTTSLESKTDSLNAKIEEIIETMGSKTLSSSDFVNGRFIAGTGISSTDYTIISSNPIKVSVGDRVSVKPNGLKVWVWIDAENDLSLVETHLKNLGMHTENFEYVSEYDGYLVAQIVQVDGASITPSDYTCDISVSSNRENELEQDIDTLSGEIDGIKERVEKIENEGVEVASTIPASPKHKPFTRIINDCQTASDWTINNNDNTIVSADTTSFILGNQSLRCDKQMRCTKHTYDLLNNDLVIKLRINSIAKGASLQLRIGDLNGNNILVYELARGSSWTTPTDWQEVAIPYTGYVYGDTDLDYSAIKDIYLMSSGGAVDWNLQYIGLRPKRLKKGIVTFTFDDGYKSQYTGIKALAERGITGTIFHITPANEDGLSVSELQDLVNLYGADIEVHGDPAFITDTVPESERGGFAAAWTEESLKAYWENIQKFLKENGLSEGKHMAYPNGMYPDRVVQLARSYFDSCRTITPYIPLEAYPAADRYRIRAVSGVSANGVTVDKVKQYIDRANESGAWLILVFHKIGDGADSMWCSEADLKAIADYAIESGAHIMNYTEVFESGILE